MSDQPTKDQETPEPKSWREERRERRMARRAALGGRSMGGGLIIGLLLVVLGGVFFLQNFGKYPLILKNWGALFILVPAVAAFERAYRFYRNAGNRLTGPARGAFLVGIVLVVVTAVIILNLNWSIYGPLLIILVGLGLLLNSMLPSGKE
jgi:hypothetical protein